MLLCEWNSLDKKDKDDYIINGWKDFASGSEELKRNTTDIIEDDILHLLTFKTPTYL